MRILGIDLGSTSIKMVELDSAFGRYEIFDYHEMAVPPDEEPARVAQRMLQGLKKSPDKIAVTLPANQVTFRNLQLPTREKKAVQAAIAFELEDELPFELEDCVYDFTILSQGKQGTNVHIETTLKKYVLDRVSVLKSFGIDPDLVTSEAWSFRTLMNAAIKNKEAQASPIALIHMGATHTTLYVHWKGLPVLLRDIPWGGRDVTEAIGTKYNLSAPDAERVKLDNGFVLTSQQRSTANADQIEFSETIYEASKGFLGEIRQTSLTSKKLTREAISMIYLSGGASLLPGLRTAIEEELSIPVVPFQSLGGLATTGSTSSSATDAHFSLAAAVALCMTGQERSGAISFRKGELGKVGSRGLSLSNLKYPAIAAGAVVTCLSASILVQSKVYRGRLEEVNSKLEKNVGAFFGSASKGATKTYLSNISKLRDSIQKEVTKAKELDRLLSENPHSPLDFLRTLSGSIPKSVTLDMAQYQVGSSADSAYDRTSVNTITLKFIIPGPQTAERIEASLQKLLTDLKREKLEALPSQGGSEGKWQAIFSGKVREDAYGN